MLRSVEVKRGKRAASQELWQGIADSLPVVLGVTPFGITCGVMGLTAGLTGLETLLMSMLVFAGASQFVSITMLGAGVASGSVIVLTTLLINLRHFTALIVPGLLLPKGYLDLTIHNHYLVAGLIATFTAYKSRNIIVTIGIGMAVMIMLKLVG